MVIGITGGIGSGKSRFTRGLAARLGNAPTMDADLVARELLVSDAEAVAAVRARFGDWVFDAVSGAVSRERLREIVFNDAAARRDLEAILHPRVRRHWVNWAESRRRLRDASDAPSLVEIPLLYETGAEEHFDRVVVVACRPETQERRLREHRGLPVEVARRILASQLPVAEKIRRADHVVWNDADGDTAFDRQTDLLAALFLSLLNSADHPTPRAR